MTEKKTDMRCDALLFRALVPKGYRPTNPDDIDRMLDAIGDEQISEEKMRRMLRKINGEEPLFPKQSSLPPPPINEITEQERELIALHRSKKNPLPPDLLAKLRAMEKRASRKPNQDEAAHGD